MPHLAIQSHFNSRITSLFGAPLFLTILMTSPAFGFQTQLNSGGTVDITSTMGAVAISNDTQVNVLDGGEVRRFSGDADVLAASVTDTSILTLSGTGEINAVTGSPGGQPGGNATGVVLNQNSQLLLSGGSINVSTSDGGAATGVVLNDTAQLTITGGNVRATTSGGGASNTLLANDDSNIEISGGNFAFESFTANDSANIAVSGGSFSSGRFTANGDSTISFFGASNSFAVFTANEMSDILISGGIVSPGSTFSGTLNALDDATIRLRGSDIIFDPDGTVTGNFSDGTAFDFNIQTTGQGTIVAVPEPSSLAVLTLAGVVVGFRRKRRLSH